MGIFEIAERYGWVGDYMDLETGLIYKIGDYKRYKDNPCMKDLPGIPVFQGTKLIGYASEKQKVH